MELSCKEAEGSPPSEYQWYKNGIALLEKTGTGSARTANITYTMNKKSGTLVSVVTNCNKQLWREPNFCTAQKCTVALIQGTRSFSEINVMLKCDTKFIGCGFCLRPMTNHKGRMW